MPNTITRTDIQPSWLELPEEVYWYCTGEQKSCTDENAHLYYYLLFVTPSEAIKHANDDEDFEWDGDPPCGQTIEEAMQDALDAGAAGVRIDRWCNGRWETLASYDVCSYFAGADRG